MKKCKKCGVDRFKSNGDVNLCSCDLKEVEETIKSIRKIKTSKKGFFKGFKEVKK